MISEAQQAIIDTLTPHEQQAVEAAIPAWIAAAHAISARDGRYRGLSAEKILARCGIPFEEVQGRARELTGAAAYSDPRDVRTCDTCGGEYTRSYHQSRNNFAKRRFCGRDCIPRELKVSAGRKGGRRSAA
jgi:hypothetical protein